jgi:hypothetical protein
VTWRRIALYYLLLGVALVVYVGTSPPATVPEEPAGKVRLLDLRVDELGEVHLTRGNAWVRCVQEAGRWRVLEPHGAAAPPDLMATFVLTLVETMAAEVVEGDTGNGTQFGMTGERATRIALYRLGHEDPVVILLGARNPTETAVYATVAGRPEVFLVGRVLQYYADGILDAVQRGRAPVPSEEPAPAIDDDRARTAG